jgi:hypothetical protein
MVAFVDLNIRGEIGRLENLISSHFYCAFPNLFFEPRNQLSVAEYLLRTERHFDVIESNHEIPAC